MGIKQLSKVIADNAPKAITEHPLKHYFGRKVAIDASMSIYQFLIAVRTDNGVLTNASGTQTSHLIGLFYRTLRLLENGIKPIYVFDGKPPEMKTGELAKRTEARQNAQAALATAAEHEKSKLERRLVKVTPEHVQECQELLDVLGVPWISAPGEAEAQCAELVRGGLAYGVASEDMDTLTFGAPVMLRHMTASEAKKLPIVEFNLDNVLKGMQLSMKQFIDLCILLGCDYCDTLKGIGPMRAVALIKQHESIEGVLAAGTEPPESWPFDAARQIFLAPEVIPCAQIPPLEWKAQEVSRVVEYLVGKHGFNEKRVETALERIAKATNVGNQKRMDDFFKPIATATPAANKENGSKKKTTSASAEPNKKKQKK